jgi:hypothetical protein
MTDNGVVKVSEVDMAESSERKKWLQSNRNKFNAEDFSVVKQTINSISGDKLQSVFDASFLNLTCMYILATFSLERIWLGNTFMWILKVASWGFLVPGTIWWIIDLITVKKRTHKHNMQAFSKTVSIL